MKSSTTRSRGAGGTLQEIEVTLNADGSATVNDDGRAFLSISIPRKACLRRSGDDAAACRGKFNQNPYKVSGACTASAFRWSTRFRNFSIAHLAAGLRMVHALKDGDAEAPLKAVGKSGKTGTEVVSSAVEKSFHQYEFDFNTVEHRCANWRFPIPVSILPLRCARRRAESFGNALRRRPQGIRRLARPFENPVHVPAIVVRKDNDGGIAVECAMQWNDSYHENMLCFTNNIPQKDGGTHLAGFRAALTRTVINMPRPAASRKRKKSIYPARICAKASLACFVKMPDPKFSSQTKESCLNRRNRR